MNTYLIQALRAYRIVNEGQFGSSTSSTLQLTQDAADEIARLNARVEALERGVVVPLMRVARETGMVQQRRWTFLGELLEKHEGTGAKVNTLVATASGLLVVWE